jgi:hypothetical protein
LTLFFFLIGYALGLTQNLLFLLGGSFMFAVSRVAAIMHGAFKKNRVSDICKNPEKAALSQSRFNEARPIAVESLRQNGGARASEMYDTCVANEHKYLTPEKMIEAIVCDLLAETKANLITTPLNQVTVESVEG